MGKTIPFLTRAGVRAGTSRQDVTLLKEPNGFLSAPQSLEDERKARREDL